MMSVSLTIEQLYSRGHLIQEMLKELTGDSHGPAYKATASSSEFTIRTHGGSPSSDYEKWRFSVGVDGFRASYYERWFTIDAADESLWAMERAYLTLHRVTDLWLDEDEEYICIHCDPSEEVGAEHREYKLGPHLHVMVAEDPLPHTHFALNGGYLDEVLSSVDALSKSIKWVLRMLRAEVLDELSATAKS